MHKHTKLLWLAALAIGTVSTVKPRENKEIEYEEKYALKTEVATLKSEIGASMYFAQKDAASFATELRELKLKLNKEDVRAVCKQPQHGLGMAACVTNHGGAWTVIQRRTKGDVLFSRGWEEYRNGFGDVKGDYWIGLKAIYEMCPQSRPCEVRIEIMYPGKPYAQHYVKQSSGRYVAQYDTFGLSGPADKYMLTIRNYDSEASTIADDMSYHNQKQFSTKDVDNDKMGHRDCAKLYGEGGWWYGGSVCYLVSLNGKWKLGEYHGLGWSWLAHKDSVDSSLIMIRPAF